MVDGVDSPLRLPRASLHGDTMCMGWIQSVTWRVLLVIQPLRHSTLCPIFEGLLIGSLKKRTKGLFLWVIQRERVCAFSQPPQTRTKGRLGVWCLSVCPNPVFLGGACWMILLMLQRKCPMNRHSRALTFCLRFLLCPF